MAATKGDGRCCRCVVVVAKKEEVNTNSVLMSLRLGMIVILFIPLTNRLDYVENCQPSIRA